MKTLALGFFASFFISNAFAADAVGQFKTILNVGTYSGINEKGACFVEVKEVNFPNTALNIKITDNDSSLSKLLNDNAVYAIKTNERIFYQSDRTLVDNSGDFLERFLRTNSTPDGLLHIEIGESTVVEEDYQFTSVECNLL